MNAPESPRVEVPLDHLQAKVRGKRGRLYEGDRLARLREKRSVNELWRELYPRENATGRLALERLLRRDCAHDLSSLLYLLPDSIHPLYAALVRRFQLDTILVLLRMLAGPEHSVRREEFIPELPPPLKLDPASLLDSSGPEDFQKKLPPFYRLDNGYVPGFSGLGGTGAVEMALERAWWLQVLEQLGRLPGRDREDCARPVISELASARLLAVLRAGRFYELDWQKLLPVLPPTVPENLADEPLAADPDVLHDLFENPDGAEIAGLIPDIDPDDAGDLSDLENILWTRTCDLADEIYYASQTGPSVIICYFYIKRNEMHNLIDVIEDLHYGSMS
ncbi:MAG: V0D/AC39 family V-type ATPase subunit [Planctomycetota bacterium]